MFSCMFDVPILGDATYCACEIWKELFSLIFTSLQTKNPANDKDQHPLGINEVKGDMIPSHDGLLTE